MSPFAIALAVALAQANTPAAAADAPVVTAPVAAAAPQPAPEVPWWQKVTLSGYARIGLYYTLPLNTGQLVGGNGGFRLADFRLGLDFHPVEKFSVTTSIELAAPLVSDADPLVGRSIVDLRDAYVTYSVCSGFNLRAGQQRSPYDAEMLLPDGALPFVSRSILAVGLTPPDGYGPRLPLAPDRQLGLQIFSNRLGGDFGLKYAVGAFNSNGLNQLFNSNNYLAPVARVEVDFKQHVTLGVNANYVIRTDGTRPNLVNTNQLGYGADLEVHGYGVSALVTYLANSSTYSYAGLQGDSAMGVMGQVRYFHEGTGLEVAARVAWLEPSRVQVQDQVTEIAGMVGWKPFRLPFRVLAQYTHREEEAGVSYPNDSVDVMIHAVW